MRCILKKKKTSSELITIFDILDLITSEQLTFNLSPYYSQFM